ncbi:aminoglycoside phosphotransferase [Clostridium putrefaciens]|uniref:Aminoglycoside phosphotransferase n=1 Tax=Clostridium putrefaciens TaxID=99675 RepID=A0A381J5J0_9CLOT|nr:aminoglycoside phosphotransferase family protein [Clostridium putrefaciens]SUY46574.1 aminoglycoside phosphotransferase [Clostridium putrefaciens]
MIELKDLERYAKESLLKTELKIPKESEIVFSVLGKGEYNINYLFSHPFTGEKLVLRLNTKSQIHLDNQIEYEYKTLELLEKSKRTPKPLYVDSTRSILPYGILVMEYLPGRALSYSTDLEIAARCLGDIHSINLPINNHLIKPKDPLVAIVDECIEMSLVYLKSNLADHNVKEIILNITEKAKDLVLKRNLPVTRRCLINTELNSGNFLINGERKGNYIIDWEKPILGEPEQDLGHFLAPTTTFWKTDVILTREEIDFFVKAYINRVSDNFDTEYIEEKLNYYLAITCLRGITWCSMAFIEYQNPDKLIRNEFTYNKIKKYLEIDFLNNIMKSYFI